MKMSNRPYSHDVLLTRLEELYEVEFTWLKVEHLVEGLVNLDRTTQDFIIGWAERLLTTNVYISHEFIIRVVDAIDKMERRVIEAWAVHAADVFDREGLRPALEVIQKVDSFVGSALALAEGVMFEEVEPILSTFVCGLAGRRLKLAQGETVYTDSETLHLPNITARLEKAKDNFLLCKAQVAFMWAQTRFGSFRVDFASAFDAYPDKARAIAVFHALDTLRIEACLGRELPGLWRDMQQLDEGGVREESKMDGLSALQAPNATVNDVLALLPHALELELPTRSYYPALNPEAVRACMLARMEREKMLLRVKLAELAKELGESPPPPAPSPSKGEGRKRKRRMCRNLRCVKPKKAAWNWCWMINRLRRRTM